MNKREAEQIIKECDEKIVKLEMLRSEAVKELEKKDEVPECYSVESGNEMHFVDYDGQVYSDGLLKDAIAIKNHRAFKTKKIAKLFADKTQIIADQLYFKELFDKDYKPDWSDTENYKSYLFFSTKSNTYKVAGGVIAKHSGTVYFSDDEIAQKCADWLNSRKGKQ